MEGYIGKMGKVDIQECISKHKTCIEVDRGFEIVINPLLMNS